MGNKYFLYFGAVDEIELKNRYPVIFESGRITNVTRSHLPTLAARLF